MMDMKNVLVAAAHPDDEALGVGGTIPLLKEAGCMVTVVVVADGSSSQYAGDTAIAQRKEQQLREANRILGTDEVYRFRHDRTGVRFGCRSPSL